MFLAQVNSVLFDISGKAADLGFLETNVIIDEQLAEFAEKQRFLLPG